MFVIIKADDEKGGFGMKEGRRTAVWLLLAAVLASCPVPDTPEPAEIPESPQAPIQPPAGPPARWRITAPGSITNGSLNTDKMNAAAGETVTLTISPSSGYQLNAISVTGAVLSGIGNTKTFTMPPMDATVSGSFATSPEPRFVAVGMGNIAAWSADGLTWTAARMPDNSNWRSVTWGGY
jgi:hypothetical protein